MPTIHFYRNVLLILLLGLCIVSAQFPSFASDATALDSSSSTGFDDLAVSSPDTGSTVSQMTNDSSSSSGLDLPLDTSSSSSSTGDIGIADNSSSSTGDIGIADNSSSSSSTGDIGIAVNSSSSTGSDSSGDGPSGSNSAAGTAIAAVLGTLAGLFVIFYLYRRFCRHGFSASGVRSIGGRYKSAELMPHASTRIDIEDDEDYGSEQGSEEEEEDVEESSDDEDRGGRHQ